MWRGMHPMGPLCDLTRNAISGNALRARFNAAPTFFDLFLILSMPLRRNNDLAKQLWAVGDPVRLRILQLLPQTAECEHGNNVSTLAKRLGLSQPTVSH